MLLLGEARSGGSWWSHPARKEPSRGGVLLAERRFISRSRSSEPFDLSGVAHASWAERSGRIASTPETVNAPEHPPNTSGAVPSARDALGQAGATYPGVGCG